MWTMIIRRRLAFLVGVLVIAVALAALQQVRDVSVAEACTVLLFLLVAGLFLACLIARNARHPATFLVRNGGFATPPDATFVMNTAMLTVLVVTATSSIVVETRAGFGFRPDLADIVFLALALLLVPLLWYVVLGPFGAVLRPDGLLDRQPFGSLFVPWEAGPTAEPTTRGVKLRFARPDLVVRRGFRPGTSIRTGTDRGFTAWAINLYAVRPDYRPTIGADDGLVLLKSH